MLTNYLIIAAVILVVVILLVLIIWRLRSRRFHPDSNKQNQQNELNADLEETGFAYELNGDYFYSLMDCWQREVGYCRLYDEAAPLFNMIMDCEPVTFSYGGKRWLIELWKGQYGITTGAEIGIYYTERNDIDSPEFKGTFYENINDKDRMKMSFVLRRNGKVILRRSAVHWWLTGFKLGMFSNTGLLTMDAKITFPDRGMRNAFVESLVEIGYRRKEYSVTRNTVTIHYTTPHSPQTDSRNKASETLVQQTNRNNCKLYEFATGKYSDTLDKLEYLKAMAPELYQIFIDSLYARGVYEAFDWIKDLLVGISPDPGPGPEPWPPVNPCPPVHPCPPPVHPCPPPVHPCPPPVRPCPPQVHPCPEPPERHCPPAHHCPDPQYQPCCPGHQCQPHHNQPCSPGSDRMAYNHRQCSSPYENDCQQRQTNNYNMNYRDSMQNEPYRESPENWNSWDENEIDQEQSKTNDMEDFL